jgi:hypothetical protein
VIDIEKMKALLARVNDCTKPVDAADRNGIMQLVESLLSELEAREANRRDAERYRWIRSLSRSEMYARGVELDWHSPTENLDAVIDTARAGGAS